MSHIKKRNKKRLNIKSKFEIKSSTLKFYRGRRASAVDQSQALMAAGVSQAGGNNPQKFGKFRKIGIKWLLFIVLTIFELDFQFGPKN